MILKKIPLLQKGDFLFTQTLKHSGTFFSSLHPGPLSLSFATGHRPLVTGHCFYTMVAL